MESVFTTTAKIIQRIIRILTPENVGNAGRWRILRTGSIGMERAPCPYSYTTMECRSKIPIVWTVTLIAAF
jgi:hypothetical protein